MSTRAVLPILAHRSMQHCSAAWLTSMLTCRRIWPTQCEMSVPKLMLASLLLSGNNKCTSNSWPIMTRAWKRSRPQCALCNKPKERTQGTLTHSRLRSMMQLKLARSLTLHSIAHLIIRSCASAPTLQLPTRPHCNESLRSNGWHPT
eukprot:8551335-Karenia_brevis.AAC.1